MKRRTFTALLLSLLGNTALASSFYGGLPTPHFMGGASGGSLPSPPIGAFSGNPNVTITAIDVTGGIVTSRTSGQLPAFIQVSASAITATGTSIPYEDLEYSWDFGDPSGVETFTSWSTTPNGVSANANTAQKGPEAAYCYRAAGTYTITLTVRGKNGSGYTTATKTTTFTASAFSASGGEWYFDSAAAGGDGLTPATAFNDLATLNLKLAIANTLIHVKKGSSWTASTGNVLVVAASGIRVDTYGSGAKPIFDSTGVDVLNLSIQSGSQNLSDIVFSGTSFTCNANTPDASPMIWVAPNSSKTFTDIYFDNISVVGTGDQVGVIFMDVSQSDIIYALNGGFWNCTINNTSTPARSTACIFGMPGQWGFVVGGTYGGNSGDSVHAHHIYPNTAYHSLYRYIDFVAATGKNCNINTNTGPFPSLPDGVSQYVCMSDNNFTGTQSAWDASNANSTAVLADGYFKNFVSQFNAIHDFLGTPCFFSGCRSMTIRHNKIWGNTDYDVLNLSNGKVFSTAMRIYGNYVYVPSNAGVAGTGIWAFDADANGNSAPWGVAQTITDNIVEDDRTGASAMTGGFLDWQSASSFVDRNTYYIPNDSNGQIWYNNPTGNNNDFGTETSLVTMQGTYGFELNSTATATSNPSWPDPANGNFG